MKINNKATASSQQAFTMIMMGSSDYLYVIYKVTTKVKKDMDTTLNDHPRVD